MSVEIIKYFSGFFFSFSMDLSRLGPAAITAAVCPSALLLSFLLFFIKSVSQKEVSFSEAVFRFSKIFLFQIFPKWLCTEKSALTVLSALSIMVFKTGIFSAKAFSQPLKKQKLRFPKRAGM